MTRDALPMQAQIIGRTQESPTIFTLRLRLTDRAGHGRSPTSRRANSTSGVYLYGVGEVPVTIVSDPA